MFVTLLLQGCGRIPILPGLAPHKIDIQQGNYVTQDMLAKLQPGMSRNQVRFALGTALIVDPFRNDRWDYVYLLYKKGELAEQRLVTVIFRGEVLDRIEGDVVAGANISQPSASGKPAAAVPTVPAAVPDKK